MVLGPTGLTNFLDLKTLALFEEQAFTMKMIAYRTKINFDIFFIRLLVTNWAWKKVRYFQVWFWCLLKLMDEALLV